MFHQLNKNAFTLAEVLIVLGIIGIIAEFTIPTLYTNMQKNITATRLQKEYSTLSQAFQMSVAENGEPSSWDWGIINDMSATNQARIYETYFIPYFSVLKNCKFETSGECQRDTAHTNLNGYSLYIFNSNYLIYLKDGSELCFFLVNFAYPNGSTSKSIRIYLDINGDEKPNILGKDIFFLLIDCSTNKLTLYMSGAKRSVLLNGGSGWYDYGCQKAQLGLGWLGALIQRDGWKISDDYSW